MKSPKSTKWKHYPTHRLETILRENYVRSEDGQTVYEPYKEEIEKELWKRYARIDAKKQKELNKKVDSELEELTSLRLRVEELQKELEETKKFLECFIPPVIDNGDWV